MFKKLLYFSFSGKVSIYNIVIDYYYYYFLVWRLFHI